MIIENDLKRKTDTILLTQFSKAVLKEKQALALVILHLAEIDRRKLYAKEGYSSLYAYLIEKYHYSEGGAYRRIQAARLSLKYPKVISYLESGKLNLMAAALMSPHLNRENEEEILKTVMGKSKREIEFFIAERFGAKQETVKDEIRKLPLLKTKVQEIAATGEGKNLGSFTLHDPISNNPKEPERSSNLSQEQNEIKRRVKIVFSADESLAQKIERAKEILRHKYPKAKLEDIFDEAMEALLDRKDPERKMVRIEKRKQTKDHTKTEPPEAQRGNGFPVFTENDGRMDSRWSLPLTPIKGGNDNASSRYIPQDVRREVYLRDDGQCAYQSPDGKKCGERATLELDHIQPFALGGKSVAENLQLLCGTHNHYRAQQTFGMG